MGARGRGSGRGRGKEKDFERVGGGRGWGGVGEDKEEGGKEGSNEGDVWRGGRGGGDKEGCSVGWGGGGEDVSVFVLSLRHFMTKNHPFTINKIMHKSAVSHKGFKFSLPLSLLEFCYKIYNQQGEELEWSSIQQRYCPSPQDNPFMSPPTLYHTSYPNNFWDKNVF